VPADVPADVPALESNPVFFNKPLNELEPVIEQRRFLGEPAGAHL
jgi:hypothetical protein